MATKPFIKPHGNTQCLIKLYYQEISVSRFIWGDVVKHRVLLGAIHLLMT